MGFFFLCCCQHCPHKCLTLTFTGWGGPPTNCLCEDLDGEYILQRSDCAGCVYEWCGVKTCNNGVTDVEICLSITLEITATNRILTVSTDDATEPNFTGTISESGNPCGNMEFAPGDITGITSPGTVTVTTATCPSGTQPPCCTDCCDTGLIQGTGAGPVPNTNEYSPPCCGYLTYTDSSVSVTVPVGVNGTWMTTDNLPFPAYSVTSTCERAYYIDYTYIDGSPTCHEHVTTAKRSIVMNVGTGNAIIEVFLSDNCCPESVQVHQLQAPPTVAAVTLNFGPATIADYFEVGGETYDLFICDDAPQGGCCLPGDFYLGQRTEYECERVGDGIDTGVWTEGGTSCP